MKPSHAASAPPQTERDTDLAAGRPWQKLAKGNQIRIAALAQPLSAHHELIAEIAQVSDWAAEGGQPQAKEDQKYSPGVAVGLEGIGHGRWVNSDKMSQQ